MLNAYRLSKNLEDGNGLVLLFHKVEAKPFEVTLSSEHDGYEWISKDDLDLITNSPDRYIESGYLEAVKLALELV